MEAAAQNGSSDEAAGGEGEVATSLAAQGASTPQPGTTTAPSLYGLEALLDDFQWQQSEPAHYVPPETAGGEEQQTSGAEATDAPAEGDPQWTVTLYSSNSSGPSVSGGSLSIVTNQASHVPQAEPPPPPPHHAAPPMQLDPTSPETTTTFSINLNEGYSHPESFHQQIDETQTHSGSDAGPFHHSATVAPLSYQEPQHNWSSSTIHTSIGANHNLNHDAFAYNNQNLQNFSQNEPYSQNFTQQQPQHDQVTLLPGQEPQLVTSYGPEVTQSAQYNNNSYHNSGQHVQYESNLLPAFDYSQQQPQQHHYQYDPMYCINPSETTFQYAQHQASYGMVESYAVSSSSSRVNFFNSGPSRLTMPHNNDLTLSINNSSGLITSSTSSTTTAGGVVSDSSQHFLHHSNEPLPPPPPYQPQSQQNIMINMNNNNNSNLYPTYDYNSNQIVPSIDHQNQNNTKTTSTHHTSSSTTSHVIINTSPSFSSSSTSTVALQTAPQSNDHESPSKKRTREQDSQKDQDLNLQSRPSLDDTIDSVVRQKENKKPTKKRKTITVIIVNETDDDDDDDDDDIESQPSLVGMPFDATQKPSHDLKSSGNFTDKAIQACVRDSDTTYKSGKKNLKTSVVPAGPLNGNQDEEVSSDGSFENHNQHLAPAFDGVPPMVTFITPPATPASSTIVSVPLAAPTLPLQETIHQIIAPPLQQPQHGEYPKTIVATLPPSSGSKANQKPSTIEITVPPICGPPKKRTGGSHKPRLPKSIDAKTGQFICGIQMANGYCQVQFSTFEFLKVHQECHVQLERPALKAKRKVKSKDKSAPVVEEPSKDRSEPAHQPPRKYQCCFCYLPINDWTSTKRHLYQNHGIDFGLHKCAHCSYSHVERNKLKAHELIHTNEKKFACDKCGKLYINSRQLRNHVRRIHLKLENKSGQQYQCEDCGYQTNRSSNLSKHRRHVHPVASYASNYQCDLCPYKTMNRTDFAKHVEAKHQADPFAPKYSCKTCPFTSNGRDVMRRHEKVHTKIKAHTCPYCTFSGIQPRQIFAHVKSWHKEKAIREGQMWKCADCRFGTLYEAKAVKHTRMMSHRFITVDDLPKDTTQKKQTTDRMTKKAPGSVGSVDATNSSVSSGSPAPQTPNTVASPGLPAGGGTGTASQDDISQEESSSQSSASSSSSTGTPGGGHPSTLMDISYCISWLQCIQ